MTAYPVDHAPLMPVGPRQVGPDMAAASGLLAGRVACITGAGSGLGRAIAERFASEGAIVVAQDIDAESAQQTVASLAGDGHLPTVGDVADEQAMLDVFAAISDRFGRIDVMVNNAGVDRLPGDGFDMVLRGEGPQITLMAHEAFSRMLAIHVTGTFTCTREAVRLMGDGGGSIITMSSIAGVAGWGPVHYSAAKGAILGFTRAAARELGPLGIRVNAIAPGAIDTPMTRSLPEGLLAPMVAMTPLRRLGRADEVAASALFLASDESSYMTGQCMSPNGGIVTV
ncbi:MAG: SDR family oxidoreductase [Acidimicrobiales bacterium]|nr:SDR family oxidoreductase [Acidimicrobiales bacterium]